MSFSSIYCNMNKDYICKASSIEQKETINKKILVVEDDYTNRFYIQKILEKNNYIADVVEDGIYVEDKLKKNKYDIILMDLSMPIMNGFKCIKMINYLIIKNVIKSTKIIALTAFGVEYDKFKCLSKGFCDYISKPFVEKELIDTINYWLEPLMEN